MQRSCCGEAISVVRGGLALPVGAEATRLGVDDGHRGDVPDIDDGLYDHVGPACCSEQVGVAVAPAADGAE